MNPVDLWDMRAIARYLNTTLENVRQMRHRGQLPPAALRLAGRSERGSAKVLWLPDAIRTWAAPPSPGEQAQPELWSIKRIARHFDVSHQSVRRWIRDGRLPPPEYRFQGDLWLAETIQAAQITPRRLPWKVS